MEFMAQAWNLLSVRKKGLVVGMGLTGLMAFSQNQAIAQVTPEAPVTLPTPTVVTTPDATTFEITGGTSVGTALFHSFSQFNLIQNQTANFDLSANPSIQNVLSRIIGGSSSIDGTIRVTGGNSPNLFLMNPNGIIFGPNASLDISGSFVATTANQIGFEGGVFSTNPSVPLPTGLLVVKPNALFFNQLNRNIESRSVTEAGLEFSERQLYGLRVPNGQSLLLVGNGILIDGGNIAGGLIALGGNVEMASILDGQVELKIDGNKIGLFPLSNTVVRGEEINLIQKAEVNVRGVDEGSLSVQTRNLRMEGGSILLAGISPFQTVSTPDSKAGDIVINATEEILLTDVFDFFERTTIANSVGITETPNIEGQGGNIIIQTKTLRVTNGAQIFASTFGESRAGDVTIQGEEIYFAGDLFVEGQAVSSQAFVRVQDTAQGDGGTLLIQANTLSVTDGASLNSSTLGGGLGGKIIVEKANLVIIDGIGKTGRLSSLIADTLSSSDAGSIEIDTKHLEIKNGARVSAESTTPTGGRAGTLVIKNTELVSVDGPGSTLNFNTRSEKQTSDAGNLQIYTNQLQVSNGGQISARTTGSGDAGTLRVQAAKLVKVDGFGSKLSFDSESSGNAQPDAISIETDQLLVQNQGLITVDGFGTGATGDLNIISNSIRMLNQGQITATTQTGIGGNIRIKIGSGNLKMGGLDAKGNPIAGGNEIRARAIGSGDGGNVIIMPISNESVGAVISTSILADNDILAIADTGKGGLADAEEVIAVVGFVPLQDVDTPLSDFTAESRVGFDGRTLLPERDPVEEPVPLDFLRAEIAQGCQALSAPVAQSKFIITGRGGVAVNPGNVLSGDAIAVDLVTRDTTSNSSENSSVTVQTDLKVDQPIVEAQNWVKNQNGTIALIAQAPTQLPFLKTLSDCGASSSSQR